MRRILASVVALVSLLILAGVFGVPADAQPHELPAPRVIAHEWGVWKVSASGAVTHLEDLAAELPPFVHGARPHVAPVLPPQPVVPVLPPQPVPAPHPPVARKPVLFLYTDRTVDMTISVGFRGGQPWMHFPDAEPALVDGVPGLTWHGQLHPIARAALLPVEAGHFWADLRQVSPALLVTHGGGSAERFVFYDGPVRFERPFLIARRAGGALVTPMSSERTLWLASGDRFTESQIAPGTQAGVLTAQGDMATLRGRLLAALGSRGLSGAEAEALLSTWRDDLFASPAPRAIYFVPRDLYDRMLPLRIDPAPTELVRVGLVIEEL